MELNLTDREEAILTSLVVSAWNEAGRDGRTGPWVDSVRALLTKLDVMGAQPSWKVNPKGGEPFGTKVTFWSTHCGIQRAVITWSPKPEAERDRLDPGQWQIAIFDQGMTHAPAEQITLGWHPDAYGMDTPA